MLAYVKFFDPTLDDDDPENSYMEREWRTTTAVPFVHDDIATVYAARGWSQTAHDYGFTGRIVELP